MEKEFGYESTLYWEPQSQEHRSRSSKESGFRGQVGAMDCPEKGTTEARCPIFSDLLAPGRREPQALSCVILPGLHFSSIKRAG